MIGSSLVRAKVTSPNHEPRNASHGPSLLILHYTGMENASRACSWLCNPESRVSCHYLVDEEGLITQMVSETERAWHAGVSSWHGETDINSHSVGIEIHNPGHFGGYPDFPAAQMTAVADLCRDIVKRHAILPQNVLAHSDVAPGRKIDPGEKFDWRMLSDHGVGHWVEAAPIETGPVLQTGDSGPEVLVLQHQLSAYGYGLDASGVFDERTQIVIEAFQRHFRQTKVDGKADQSTRLTLDQLLASLGQV